MADNDNNLPDVLIKTFPKVAAGVKSVGANNQQVNQLAGYATLFNEHKRLSSLPDGIDRNEWNRLNPDLQDAMLNVYGNTSYNNDGPKKSPFTKVLDVLVDYTKTLTAPYRIARMANQGDFEKTVTPEVQEVIKSQPRNILGNVELFLEDQWKYIQSEAIYDKKQETLIAEKYNPVTFKIAKQFSSGKDPSIIMGLAESQEELDAIYNFAIQDEEASKNSEMAQIIQELQMAKISPGRDAAWKLGLKKYNKIATKKDLYDLTSGTIDAFAIIGLDPATWVLGPGYKAYTVSTYGLLTTAGLSKGEDLTRALGKLFSRAKVRRYWDEVGARVDRYSKTDDLVTRAQIADELSRVFNVKTSTLISPANPSRPYTIDLISEWAKAGIKDADSALKYFEDIGTLQLIGRGSAGGRVPLMPTYSMMNKFRSEYLNPAIRKLLGLSKNAPKVWDTAEEFSKSFTEAAIGNTADEFLKTKNVLDKTKRLFEKSLRDKEINFSTPESTNTFRFLVRTAGMNDYTANLATQAWREGTPGLRLRMYVGTLLTIGRKLGLDSSNDGKLILEKIKQTSQHLYAPDITVLNALEEGTNKVANIGIRSTFNNDLSALTAKTSGYLADASAKRKILSEELKDLSKQLKQAKANNEPLAKIESIEKSIKRAGSMLKDLKLQSKTIRAGIGLDRQFIIRESLEETGARQQAIDDYITILKQGPEEIGQQAYDATLARVTAALKKSTKHKNQFADPKFDFATFFLKAFPTKEEIAKNLNVIKYNPAQIGNEQYGILWYQQRESVSVPDLVEWARLGAVSPVSKLFKINNNYLLERATDIWSWFNLIGTLGFRSVIEEVGFFGLTARSATLKNYFLGKAISTELRYAKYGTGALGTINKIVYKYVKGDPISAVERKTILETPDGLAKIVASRVAQKKALSSLTGLKPETTKRYVEGFIGSEYGLSVIDEINEGALSSLNIGDYATQNAAKSMQKRFGSYVAEWNPIAKEAYAGFKSKAVFDSFNFNDGLDFKVNWLTSIYNAVDSDRNLKFGEIVLKGLKNNQKKSQIIDNLLVYIDDLAKQDKLKSVVIYETQGPRIYAERLYDTIIIPFTKRNGFVNKKLVDKVVQTQKDLITGSKITRFNTQLTLDDISKFAFDDAPEAILGKRYIPYAKDVEGIISTIENYGMGWMAKQISILGREPIFIANYFTYRKSLDAAEEAIKKTHIKNGLSEDLADSLSNQWSANVSLSLSRDRTLAYVDNPNVRTNLAFTSRNLARYYRATEDFYRRAARLVRFNPTALVKARVLAEGLDHAGFIYEDPNSGEKYFVYPGDDITYKMIAFGMSGFTNTDVFKQPMPGEFTGKISMLTPSIDPEASLPTLSGPLSAIVINAFDALFVNRFFPQYSDELKKITLGKYAVGRSGFEAFLPVKINRLFSLFSDDERNARKASITRKAISYLGANGRFPKPDASAEEIENFKTEINNVARDMAITQYALGLWLPAAPQLGVGKDVPDWIKKELDIPAFKPEYNKLLKFYGRTPDAQEKARSKWIRLFPGKSTYMVSESDSNMAGKLKSTKETVDFLQNNNKLGKKYPEAIVFLAPTDGNFDLEAYNYLIDAGYARSKTVEDFFTESIAADQYFYWRQVKSFHEGLMENLTDPTERRIERLKFDTWNQEYRKDKPLFRQYLETLGAKREDKIAAITDIRKMILDGNMPNSENGKDLAKMVKLYDDFQIQFDKIQGSRNIDINARKTLRKLTIDQLFEVAQKNAGMMNAFRTLFEPLVGE
jgi:hypothetical protein